MFCDHFRVPYRVAEFDVPSGCGALLVQSGRRLLWWRADENGRAREHRIDELRLFADVLDDDLAGRLLGREWRQAIPVRRADGSPAGSVWRCEDGSLFLPFDPDAAIIACWSEAYAAELASAGRRGLRRAAVRGYYGVRPVLPRSVQIALRRRFARIQARTPFPRWPAEAALDDLLQFLLQCLADAAGEPVPWIQPWPDDRTWAFVLTHDVETAVGYHALDRLRDVERAVGYRSSWNFVPRRYDVDDARVRELWGDGFEVGVHGLYHDGRDLESLRTLQQRLPEIRSYAKRWSSVGFRSPATHRRWEWMPMLGFEYDTSYPDTDPFEPQAGGCCSLLPFFNDDLVELPITLAQDHTIFVILRDPDERRWLEKTRFLRERGGMALLNTHPDYMLEPVSLELYERFLRAFVDDASMWHALPREVSAWWRDRSATTPVRCADEWTLEGKAAERARLTYARPA